MRGGRLISTILNPIVFAFVKRYFEYISELEETEGAAKSAAFVKKLVRIVPRYWHVARRNTEFVLPTLNHKERDSLIERSLLVLGRNLYWFSKASKLKKSDFVELMDYSEAQPIFEKMKIRATGSLILTPHFGLFELLAQSHAVLGRPCGILNRECELPGLDQYWKQQREAHGNETFGRKGGFKEIIARLNKGQDVAVLFDQNVKKNHAVFVEFFGRLAATTKSIAYASMRTDCMVVFTACVDNPPERRPLGKYRIVAREIPNPNSLEGTTDEKMRAFLTLVHKELEALILSWPEGWFWIHRRWKTRPEGELEDLYD